MTPFVRELLEFMKSKGGSATADDVGFHFWPNKSVQGIQDGGPNRGAVTAAWQLGRLRKASGYVDRIVAERPAAYRITDKGLAALAKEGT